MRQIYFVIRICMLSNRNHGHNPKKNETKNLERQLSQHDRHFAICILYECSASRNIQIFQLKFFSQYFTKWNRYCMRMPYCGMKKCKRIVKITRQQPLEPINCLSKVTKKINIRLSYDVRCSCLENYRKKNWFVSHWINLAASESLVFGTGACAENIDWWLCAWMRMCWPHEPNNRDVTVRRLVFCRSLHIFASDWLNVRLMLCWCNQY